VFVAREILDKFSHHVGVSILVIGVVFTTYVLLLLILTFRRDLGILPPEQEEGYRWENTTLIITSYKIMVFQ